MSSIKKKKQANKKHYCLICEKQIEIFDKDCSSSIEGGTISVHFGFGSQFDYIALRQPKYDMRNPILKDKPGYTEINLGSFLDGKKNNDTVYVPNLDAEVETIPVKGLKKKTDKIAASKNIISYICDGCFEKKIKFFHGTEL